MKLLVLNGSPRADKSNTNKLLEKFCDGFEQNKDNSIIQLYLLHANNEDLLSQITEDDIILLAFPLYVLSMPGFVKEKIELFYEGIGTGKKFLGFVQSGFPETYQFEFIEDYIQFLFTKLKFNYLGTIVKGYRTSFILQISSYYWSIGCIYI